MRVAAKGITPAQIAYWEQLFEKLTQAPSWKQDLESNGWAEDYRNAAEARKHLETEQEMLARMLVDLGVISRSAWVRRRDGMLAHRVRATGLLG